MCALSTLLTQGNSGANSSLHFAELAQLVERRLAKAKVAGSNPVFRSTPSPRTFTALRAGPGASLLAPPTAVGQGKEDCPPCALRHRPPPARRPASGPSLRACPRCRGDRTDRRSA